MSNNSDRQENTATASCTITYLTSSGAVTNHYRCGQSPMTPEKIKELQSRQRSADLHFPELYVS